MASTSTDWSRLVARRTLRLKPSALRQLLKLTARPGMISFAGGLPAAELFPLDRVAEAAAAALKRTGGAALQYGETEGIAPLREWIARRYSTPAMALKPENVLITAGSQQVLDLVGRVFLDPRDRVLVENPTYLAAIQAFQTFEAHFVPVPTDGQGLIPEALPAVTVPSFLKMVGSLLIFSNVVFIGRSSIANTLGSPFL